MFRLLNANEIECRVAQAGGKDGKYWASVLLYKDARVDQRIMDETFGPLNWSTEYNTIDGMLFCKVSVWDEKKGCWVTKENVGTESNTEKEKGLASDCLKRACFTWGLGVELYSAPRIMIDLKDGEFAVDNGRVKVTRLNLNVDAIEYDSNRKISKVVLKDSKGVVRYPKGSSVQNGSRMGNNGKSAPAPAQAAPQTKGQVIQFTSNDGKFIYKGGNFWKDAIQKTAQGIVCNDGTPIPIWIAETYNIPNEHMADFVNEVKRLNPNYNQINS